MSDFNENQPESRAVRFTVDWGRDKDIQLKVYRNGTYSKELTEKYVWLSMQESLKDMLNVAGEFSGAYDLYRVVLGKDPITGESLTFGEWMQAGFWTALEVLSAKQVLALLDNVRLGNKLLDGVSLTEKELKLFNKLNDVGDYKIVDKVDDLNEAEKASEVNGTSKYDDLYTYKYNGYDNPGPLNEVRGQPNKDFYGGRYDIEVLKEPKIYYRGGDSTSPLGQWFTETPLNSVSKVRINSAVKPQWFDKNGALTGTSTIDTVYKIEIPTGTTIYKGPVGTQGGIYQEGLNNDQVFIQEPWLLENVNVLGKQPLK
ncbi:pre-toxin TG domain-containing protein [Enterococcus sp. LJL51]|uniref:pre-toxin TG domain-containing protein n=1 Tax=Enterococcus sp. LJL51 TaxID=3416656 RepID=UPI003CF2F3F5